MSTGFLDFFWTSVDPQKAPVTIQKKTAHHASMQWVVMSAHLEWCKKPWNLDLALIFL
jgi:hypothetical protein